MTKEFGDLVKKYLPAIDPHRKFSQERNAMELEMDHSALSRVLNGSRNVGTEVALRLAHKLQVPEDGLAEFLLYSAGMPKEIVDKALAPREKLQELVKTEPGQAVLIKNEGNGQLKKLHTFYVVEE